MTKDKTIPSFTVFDYQGRFANKLEKFYENSSTVAT
jgi:hypothetical protein